MIKIHIVALVLICWLAAHLIRVIIEEVARHNDKLGLLVFGCSKDPYGY